MKRKNKRKSTKEPAEIKIEQILLGTRYIFLHGLINEKLSTRIIKELLALDKINNKKPITIFINSVGGNVDDGFAIIDAIEGINAPVITIISGEACSMAGFISVVGDKRLITVNSYWMGHDLAGGVNGEYYTTKTIARVKYMKHLQNHMYNFLKSRTKLSSKDLRKARHGELWLSPEECLKKGIVDKIIGGE